MDPLKGVSHNIVIYKNVSTALNEGFTLYITQLHLSIDSDWLQG
jgi:hypothetical protein